MRHGLATESGERMGHARLIEALDAVASFAELGRIGLAAKNLSDVRAMVAALAKTLIPGAAEVSLMLMLDGVPSSVAHTGDVALALDERQYDAMSGPCLAAACGREVYLVRDAAADDRWPTFTAAAVESGVRAALSVGFPVRDDVVGCMNIYGREPDAFDDHTVAMARAFAVHAAVAMANTFWYETALTRAANLAVAMGSRAVIEQAKGILMAQQQMTEDEAFDILSAASQRANRKLRDIAQAIVEGVARST